MHRKDNLKLNGISTYASSQEKKKIHLNKYIFKMEDQKFKITNISITYAAELARRISWISIIFPLPI